MKFSLCPGCWMSLPSKKVQRHASQCCPRWVDASGNRLLVACPYCRAFVLNACLVDHLRACYRYNEIVGNVRPHDCRLRRAYERGYRPTRHHAAAGFFQRLLPAPPPPPPSPSPPPLSFQETRAVGPASVWSQMPFADHYRPDHEQVDMPRSHHRDWMGHLLMMLSRDQIVPPTEQCNLNVRTAWYDFVNDHCLYLKSIGLQFDDGYDNHWQLVLTPRFARFCVYNDVRLPAAVGTLSARFDKSVGRLRVRWNVYPPHLLRSNHLPWVPSRRPRYIQRRTFYGETYDDPDEYWDDQRLVWIYDDHD